MLAKTNHSGVACAHCGEPVPSIALQGNDNEPMFCCAGCRSVYELLQSHQMCDYYTLSDRAGVSQQALRNTETEYIVLDKPEVAQKFTEWKIGGTARMRFQIPTMHCSSCVWLLDQLHRFDPGIRSSSVDFVAKAVAVEFDIEQIPASQVAWLLHRLGYEPLLRVEGGEGVRESAHAETSRQLYTRLGIAGFAFANVMVFSVSAYYAGGMTELPVELQQLFPILSIVLSIPVLLYSAQPWFASAWSGLRAVIRDKAGWRAWTLDIPVALGMLALFVRSVIDLVTGTGDGFLDSFTGLVFFLLAGRIILHKTYAGISFDRTYRSFFPLSARKEGKGTTEVVAIEKIVVGDTLVLRNAEVVPTDCVLLDPVAYVDYAFVTGESVPVECVQGQIVYAGGRIVGKTARLSATKDVSHAYLSSLWERSSPKQERTRYERISDRFGFVFTIGTMAIATIAFVAWLPDVTAALTVVTAVLIIACPCALTIAAPVALGAAMTALGKRGIYLRAPRTIVDLLDIDVVAFDKTGTLTSHNSQLDTSALQATSEEWCLVQALATQSTHPVSQSIVGNSDVGKHSLDAIEEFPGKGIRGIVDGIPVLIGTASFVNAPLINSEGTHVAVDGRYLGVLHTLPTIHDQHRLQQLPQLRLLISGDSPRDEAHFKALFADKMLFNQTPIDKVNTVERLKEAGKRVLMVGDGLNDASALRAADVSVSVTSSTSTLAPASDVVMRAESIGNVASLLSYASRIRSVIWYSFVFSMLYNVVGLGLAVSGQLTPVITAIIMPLSSLIVIGISVWGARYFVRREQWA